MFRARHGFSDISKESPLERTFTRFSTCKFADDRLPRGDQDYDRCPDGLKLIPDIPLHADIFSVYLGGHIRTVDPMHGTAMADFSLQGGFLTCNLAELRLIDVWNV